MRRCKCISCESSAIAAITLNQPQNCSTMRLVRIATLNITTPSMYHIATWREELQRPSCPIDKRQGKQSSRLLNVMHIMCKTPTIIPQSHLSNTYCNTISTYRGQYYCNSNLPLCYIPRSIQSWGWEADIVLLDEKLCNYIDLVGSLGSLCNSLQ